MNTKSFNSLLDFSEHLFKAATAEIFAVHAGLELSAKLIQADAKHQLGHLQPQVGPFPEWEELADSTKADKERNDYVFNADYNPLVRTGELMNSIEYEVNMSALEAIIGTKNIIGAYQEFGTKNIPPRPFMGTAAFKLGPIIAKLLGKAIIIGIGAGKDIKEEIGRELGYIQDIQL